MEIVCFIHGEEHVVTSARIASELERAVEAEVALGDLQPIPPDEIELGTIGRVLKLRPHPDPSQACDLDPNGGPGRLRCVDPVGAATPFESTLRSDRERRVSGIELLGERLARLHHGAAVGRRRAETIFAHGPVSTILTSFARLEGCTWWYDDRGVVIARPGTDAIRVEPSDWRVLGAGRHRLVLATTPLPRPGDIVRWAGGEGIAYRVVIDWRLDGPFRCTVLVGPWTTTAAHRPPDGVLRPCTVRSKHPLTIEIPEVDTNGPIAAQLMGLHGSGYRIGLPIAPGDRLLVLLPRRGYREGLPQVLPFGPSAATEHLQHHGRHFLTDFDTQEHHARRIDVRSR